MHSKHNLGTVWRQSITETWREKFTAVLSMLLLASDEILRERRVYVSDPCRPEIEHWLRNRK